MDEMNQNMGQGNYYDPYGKKKSNKVPIIIGVVIVGVLAVIAIGILAFLLFFSSPKNTYLDVERTNAKAFMKSLEEFGDSNLGKLLIPDQTKPFEVGMTLSANADINGADEMVEILNNSRLGILQQNDLDKEYGFVNMKLILDNKEFIDANMLLNKNLLGITIEDLIDKYVVIDTQNLQPLYDKIGYEEDGPTRIITNKELQEKVMFTENEKKTLEKELEKYFKIYIDNLDKENVEIAKKEEVRINGEKVKCNVAEVTITEEYLLESTKEAIETLKDDDKLLDLCFGKLEALVELYEEAGYLAEGEAEIDKSDFIDELNGVLEDLEIEEYDDENQIIMKVFYNNKKQIIQRELHSSDEYTDPIIISTYEGKESKYYAIEADGAVASYEVEMNGNQEEHELMIDDVKIKAKVDKSDKNKTDVEVTSKELEGLKINTSLYKEKNTVTLDVNAEYEEDGESLEVNLSLYTTENAKFDKIDLENETTIDIVKLSDSELEKEAEKIMNNAQKWAEKHNAIITKLMGNSSGSIRQQPTYSTTRTYPYYY